MTEFLWIHVDFSRIDLWKLPFLRLLKCKMKNEKCTYYYCRWKCAMLLICILTSDRKTRCRQYVLGVFDRRSELKNHWVGRMKRGNSDPIRWKRMVHTVSWCRLLGTNMQKRIRKWIGSDASMSRQCCCQTQKIMDSWFWWFEFQ